MLLKRRNKSIDDRDLLDTFNSEIRYVSQVKIPGLDNHNLKQTA
jgi:hypothetical protein